MNQAFPLGFPAPTAVYLSLYVVTLAVHVLFMNYALAGTLYLAVRTLSSRAARQRSRGMADAVVSALPFSVGLAITAGVAPLLFLQVLYEKNFYTANLLLQHRWMLIVPILILGFYLLYLLKLDWLRRKRWLWRVVAIAAAACMLFIAWSWTENHLLSRDEHAWVATYAANKRLYSSPETWPRLLLWVVGAFASLALLVGFQLRAAVQRGEAVAKPQIVHLSRVGLAGVVAAAVAAGVVAWVAGMGSGPARIEVAWSALAWPYLVITALGMGLQCVAWIRIHQRGRITGRPLPLAALGLALTLLASGVVREAVRLSAIDITAFYAQHARAAEAQGLWLFLLFVLVNGAVIAWTVRIGRRAAMQPVEDADAA